MVAATPNSLPSKWVSKHVPLIAAGGPVLDLACGNGRHTRLLLAQGFNVVAADINTTGLNDLVPHPRLTVLTGDLERPDWPLADAQGRFAGIVVTNYLYRPHLSALTGLLRPDGVLIYATFALGQEELGRPRNPDFLLRPDELLTVFSPQLHVIDYQATDTSQSHDAVRQYLCAVGQAHHAADQAPANSGDSRPIRRSE